MLSKATAFEGREKPTRSGNGNGPVAGPKNPARPKKSPLVPIAQWAIAAYLLYGIYVAQNGNPVGALAGSMVVFFSLLPSVIWAARGAADFPIFPLYAFTFSYTFGLQMMNNRQLVETTPPELFWVTCLAISGFLIIGTLTWMAVVKRPVIIPKKVMVVGGHRALPVLLLCLATATTFHVSAAAGWLDWLGIIETIVRAFMFCLGTLSIFILSYEVGAGRLFGWKKIVFIFLLIFTMIALSTGLLLVQAMGVGLLSVAGYIFASHKIPWKTILLFVVIVGIMHYGKYPLREKYWNDDGYAAEQFAPWEYPSLITEWVGGGVDYYFQPKLYREVERTNLLERSGLLHLFLFVQDQSGHKPFLMGETYSVLPGLFVPRILSSTRVGVHETTTILNIYFGLQSREDTENTTIGWGLFNEAYANFGYLGLGGLGMVLGGFFGWVARLSKGCPVNSYQGLLAVVVMNTAYQSEYSSGVFVSVLFQSFIALTGLRFLIMRPVKLEPHPGSSSPPVTS